jgi:hypothetical protein
LRDIATSQLSDVSEALEYSLLAENNESSALILPSDETYLDLVLGKMAAELPNASLRGEADLHRASFYVVKFVRGDSILYAFRKTSSRWGVKKAKSISTFIFSDNRLTIDERPRFDLERNFDFFALDRELIILNKARFESILGYRQAHLEDFDQLRAEPEFVAIFTDTQPLALHVGANKIRLRRMSAIRQKGHYKESEFMERLRLKYLQYRLNVSFDASHKLVLSEGNCADVITALLDHRLTSAFSQKLYDVQNATDVPGA